MINLFKNGAYLVHGNEIIPEEELSRAEATLGRKIQKEEAQKGTIAYGILKAHNQNGDMDSLKIRFDALTSHDITYVGIIQTAKASGMENFPHALHPHLLPQLPVRRRGDHQRG